MIPAPPGLWAEYTATGGETLRLPVVAIGTDVPAGEVAAMVCTRDGELAYANDTAPAAGYMLERVIHLPQ